jgi:hypothetical protein
MKYISALLLIFIPFIFCEYSGVKVAITSEIYKILTKFDLNSIAQNKTVIERAEASGSALFNYDVVCENLWIKNIVQPDKVVIEQETTPDGLPQVKVTLYDIVAAIQIEYLYVKYGLIKETFNQPTGSVKVSSVEGRYYFTKEGKVVINEFNVEIDSFDIDVRKDFLNWLIGLFKGLIKDQVEKALDKLSTTISDAINNWVDGSFAFDIGYGISLNLTNLLKPQLTQVTKSKQFLQIIASAINDYLSGHRFAETLTSVLTFGIHGACFPTGHPELVPPLTPAVDMPFNDTYFTNELQVLISTYSMNTALFIVQNGGYLQYTFTNESHLLFPWNFDTKGFSEIIPQFAEKYPNQNYKVQMKADISSKHVTPYFEMTESGAKLVVNFNLDFTTEVDGQNVEDLSLNVFGEIPFEISVKYDLLSIKWNQFNLVKIEELKNQLNIPHDQLLTIVANMWDKYVTKFLKNYTQNIAISAILTLLTKMSFKNFKLETKNGFLLASIAVDLSK